ncbi:MAG: hypothetical protein H6713_23855 [Myxococcales bacterium]|nr:hypothetical protein [Myxococcales bacterium]
MGADAAVPSGVKLILFTSNYVLLAVRGEDPCVVLCQDDVELDTELAAFHLARESGQRRAWPFAVLQDSGSWAKTLERHDLSALEDDVETSFSQYTSYDMGVVQKWEITVTARGDALELVAGLVIDNYDDIPARAQAHYPGGRDGEPLRVKLPRWAFLDAYDRALRYIRGEEQDEDDDG